MKRSHNLVTFYIQPAGIRLWSFASLFLYVRIVFTAASSVINTSVFVMGRKISCEVPFHSPKWTAINENDQGRKGLMKSEFKRTDSEHRLTSR